MHTVIMAGEQECDNKHSIIQEQLEQFFYKEKQTLMKKTHLINMLGLWIFHEPLLS